MAHGTRINGNAYGITGGKCRVNGTGYSIKKGRTLIGGTGYDITFAKETTVIYSGWGAAASFLQINGEGIYEDGTFIYDAGVSVEVRFRHPNGDIIVDGENMGSDVTLDVTGKICRIEDGLFGCVITTS